MRKNIIINGASGYLGMRIVKTLAIDDNLNIIGLASPRYEDSGHFKDYRNVKIIKVDLNKKLSSEICDHLKFADKIFHLAWIRLNDFANETFTNWNITKNLLNEIPNKSNFIFFSTVAASPKAISNYGKTKYEISKFLYDKGCCILVCGLVIEKNPTKGPFKILKKLITQFPFSINFKNGGPPVYPIMIEDISHSVKSLINENTYKKNYKLFNDPIPMTKFLKLIERLGNQKIFSFTINHMNILRVFYVLRKLRLIPLKIYEKIVTFLYKDSEYLSKLEDLKICSFKSTTMH